MIDQKAEQLRTEEQQAETKVYSAYSNPSQHDRKAPKTARDWLEACTRDLVASKEQSADSDLGLSKQSILSASLSRAEAINTNDISHVDAMSAANSVEVWDSDLTEQSAHVVTANHNELTTKTCLGCLASAEENLGQLNAAHFKTEQGKSTSEINIQESFEKSDTESKQSQTVTSDTADLTVHATNATYDTLTAHTALCGVSVSHMSSADTNSTSLESSVSAATSAQSCIGTNNKLHNGNRAIRKAVIVSKVYHRPVGGAIVEIAKLLNNLGVEAYTDQSTAVGFNLDEVPILSRRGMKDCDLIIVVGGDGSLLGASRSLVDLQVPVLGINRGHLGLLTDISPNNLEDALTKVVKGNYTTETRMMIDVRVLRRDEEGSEELIGQSLALNETVIHSGILAHMIVCRVSINGRYMYTLRSDGIIVGTPTGSTAYSLSAGGPIIEPHLDVLCLVPMFPQSLNCSPIILPGKSKVEIEFEIKDSMPEWVNVNCDGQVTIRADTKCLVKIRQHANPLHLIHPAGYDYYSVLRQKLGWGQSLVN